MFDHRGDLITEISLILPAHNEASRLSNAFEVSKTMLDRFGVPYEIIIAEDGSTDGTDTVASKLANEYECVHHLHFDIRQGKGQALSKAFELASGSVLCYVDVDLSTNMKHLNELIDSIRIEGYDISIGSRLMPESSTVRPFKRDFASKGYNYLVRKLLKSKLYDHQCGFKAFKRESLFSLMGKVEDKQWFWDTEVLVLAQLAGFKIKEFPVEWKHGGNTTVDLKRDILGMAKQILRFRKQISK